MSSNNRNSRDDCQIIISQYYWLSISKLKPKMKCETAFRLKIHLTLTANAHCPLPLLYWYHPLARAPGCERCLGLGCAHRGSLNSKCSVPDWSSTRTQSDECWPGNRQINRGFRRQDNIQTLLYCLEEFYWNLSDRILYLCFTYSVLKSGIIDEGG